MSVLDEILNKSYSSKLEKGEKADFWEQLLTDIDSSTNKSKKKKETEYDFEESDSYFGIFQNAIKLVNKYIKYSIKGDRNPIKLQIFQ